MDLILVGGFLGAGKTTILAESARRLSARGRSVGLITNDQAPNLVDTALLAHTGLPVREVAGSCFCCNFEAFRRAVQSLADAGADCVIAEPVGSCTDLSATIVQPLKAQFPEVRVAPLSVAVDPAKVREVLCGNESLLHRDAAYIYRVQLEEADRILLNKADTIDEAQRQEVLALLRGAFPQAKIDLVSAVEGSGIEPWLDNVLDSSPAGMQIATVDYDRYANGEAVLGWLNAEAGLRWTDGLKPDWHEFLRSIFAELQKAFTASQSEVGHVKMLLMTADGQIVGNLTGLHDEIRYTADGTARRLNATLTVNARVQTEPRELEFAFREALAAAAYARVAPTLRAFHCIQPGRPVPTYRYESVVN